tara:strand:+ start:61 stop:1275 length:1215 start_codon:yes stop_codon:yes gene_type:complete
MSEKAYDLYDLEDKYQRSLDDCKKFLVSKGRVVKGTKISKSRIDYMVSIKATCPLCGAIFNGKNSNTEHILPLGLGGKNVANNKIQLCVACNSAKNNLIQSYLGQPPYWKYYDDKWSTIKKFILWSEFVSDEGIKFSDSVPSMHQRFLDARFGGIEDNINVSGYGRLSSWKVGDEPNINFNQRKTKKAPRDPKNKSKGGIFSMIESGIGILGDKIFSDKKKNIRPIVRVQNAQVKEIINPPVKEKELESLEEVIIKLVGKDEMTLQKLGNKISKYENKRSGGKGTREFFATYGHKGTMKNILEKELGDKIDISGDPPNLQIKINSLESLEQVITKLVGKDQITLQNLGIKISKYENKRSGKTGTKTFFTTYGHKGTMKNILEKEMGDKVDISGEHPNLKIKIKL